MARKGITDIIAVVLLLMITISMIGFAWLWFQRTSQSAMTKTETQLEAQQNTSRQTIMIDNVYRAGGAVSIRNTGTLVINTNLVSVYSDGVKVTCDATFPATIVAGGTATCTSVAIESCSIVKVTAPGNVDTMSCA